LPPSWIDFIVGTWSKVGISSWIPGTKRKFDSQMLTSGEDVLAYASDSFCCQFSFYFLDLERFFFFFFYDDVQADSVVLFLFLLFLYRYFLTPGFFICISSFPLFHPFHSANVRHSSPQKVSQLSNCLRTYSHLQTHPLLIHSNWLPHSISFSHSNSLLHSKSFLHFNLAPSRSQNPKI